MAPKFVCFFISGSITDMMEPNFVFIDFRDPSLDTIIEIRLFLLFWIHHDMMEPEFCVYRLIAWKPQFGFDINIIDTLSGTIMRLCYIHWSQLNIVYPENEAGFPLTISSNCKGWSRTIVLQACQRGKNSQYLPWLIRTKLRIHST
jgi:hypothetical protein